MATNALLQRAPTSIPGSAPPGFPDCAKGTAFGRDPAFLEKALHFSTWMSQYYSPDVRGVTNVPETGPVLLVGNHNGLMWVPDAVPLLNAVTRRRGIDSQVHLLAFDFLANLPKFGDVIRRCGCIPASPRNAAEALALGAAVIVYPGGDWEAQRPWRERNKIDFHGREGFVKLALREGVPVVPVVAHGSHHGVFVVARGDRIARALQLPQRFRCNALPLVVGPMGLTTSLGSVPLPAEITVEFLPALDWTHLGPASADEPEVVDACYSETVIAMQAALDRLAAEKPHPLLSGSRHLAYRAGREIAHSPGRLVARSVADSRPDRAG